MLSLTVSYRNQQQTFNVQPFETVSDLIAGVRQIFQLIPKIRLLDTNRLYVLEDVKLPFGRIYQAEEQANLKVVGLQDDIAGYHPPELLENGELQPGDYGLEQSEASTFVDDAVVFDIPVSVYPRRDDEAVVGRGSECPVPPAETEPEVMQAFEPGGVFLGSVVSYIQRGLVLKADLGRCVENPQKAVDELAEQKPDGRGLLQCSNPTFDFPPRPQFQTGYQRQTARLQLSPVHPGLREYALLPEFDLKTLRPENNEVSIQQQIIRKLQDFKPYHPRIPYVPHVIIPHVDSSIPLILSVERSAQFQQFQRTFMVSPYFSGDEVACYLFQNLPGITQDQYCLKAYDDDYYFLGMRQLIEYDYVREQIREQKPLIFTVASLSEKLLQCPEFCFDERRARQVYQAKLNQSAVGRQSEFNRLVELYKDRSFKQFCISRCSGHLTGRLLYTKADALQTKQQSQQQEIQDPSRSYPPVLPTKLSVQLQTEFLEVFLGKAFIPLNTIKSLQSHKENFEPDITEYTRRHFLFQTELADFNWRKSLEKTYVSISGAFREQIHHTKIQKNQKLSLGAATHLYTQLFRGCAMQASAYLTYGSRHLSKCLFTQFLPVHTLQVRSGQLGVEADLHQTLHLPLRYQNIPPGTKVSLTLWLVNVGVLVREAGQKEDLLVFERLMDQSSHVDCVLPEQLSPRLNGSLRRLSLDPKQQGGLFYKDLGYRPVGSVLQDLFDANQVLCGGRQTLRLWPEISSFWLSSLSILGQNETIDAVELQAEVRAPAIFQKQLFDQEAIRQIQEKVRQANQNAAFSKKMQPTKPDGSERDQQVQEIMQRFANRPGALLTDEDYQTLYKAKEYLRHNPEILPIVLHAVPLHDSQVYDGFIRELQELYLQKLPLETAMELLDFEYADAVVRNLAVWQLEQLNSYDLKTFTLQLVQSLKFERSTELFKFLLTQAVNNFREFGYQFYWALRSEFRHSLGNQDLYRLMLHKILQNIPEQDRRDLLLTEYILTKLAHIARAVSLIRSLKSHGVPSESRSSIQSLMLGSMLGKLNSEIKRITQEHSTGYFKLPFSYTQLLDKFITQKSKIMDSKKAPLMLFVHKYGLGDKDAYVDGLVSSTYTAMFKTGDDLRQDALVVQMLQVMNNIWLSNGLNPRMKLYRVVPTGPLEGMIEIVPNSQTLAKITSESGGALQAFSKRPVTGWLYRTLCVEDFILRAKQGENIEGEVLRAQQQAYQKAVQNFSSSCAAFNVATFLLGVGDRHNDNVMMTREGHFFHIDFGHFMGNFKKKLGFKREKAPFFFTPDMRQVLVEHDALLGKSQEEEFLSEAAQEFNLIRRQGALFIVMVKMLVATGIEELTTLRDIQWLQKSLAPRLTEAEASTFFRQKTSEAATALMTQINNFAHLIAHK